MHIFTKEQREFITKNVKGLSNKELTELVNKKFGLNLLFGQIKSFKANHKLSSELNGRFTKGHIPANKGLKGVGGWKPTQFKKGHKPHNYRPVGSERLSKDGYIEIKVSDPNKWRGKHLIIWEKHNGPVPKSHAVIFGDGNNRNFDVNNLLLVSRKQLLTLNRQKLIQKDADLTRTAIILTDIYHKIHEKRKVRCDDYGEGT